MIFYFTGTGNSLQVAQDISEKQNERLVSIAALMNEKRQQYEFNLRQDEAVGFVYPIYSWNPPKIVLDFIRRLNFPNYSGNYIFSAVTCGDNIGNTMKTIGKVLELKGLPLHSGFSIRMPNNYVILFDVDTKDREEMKLNAAIGTLEAVNGAIAGREKGVFRIEKGPVPFILTSVINPLFNSFAIRPERFHATERCTGCGVCAKVCSCRNIALGSSGPDKDLRPVWGKECTQCLACLNYCPVHAIQFGRSTVKKGRYTNPNVDIFKYDIV